MYSAFNGIGIDEDVFNHKILHEEGLSYRTLPLLYEELGLEPISKEYAKRFIFTVKAVDTRGIEDSIVE